MKAQLFSVLASVVFLILFAFAFRSAPTVKPKPIIKYIPVPTEHPGAEHPKPADPLETVRLVPMNFWSVDFRNHSFGRYEFSSGKTIDLTLKGGDYEYNFEPSGEKGWFHLRDVYFTNVTGDGYPEAIVWLWHVQCGASCDGGSSLFYIYSTHSRSMEEIWQYETGSYAFSCGLKTITFMPRQIVLQLFGRCGQNSAEAYTSRSFQVADKTMLNFRFNGNRFVKERSEFISSPFTDVENYEPQLQIIE